MIAKILTNLSMIYTWGWPSQWLIKIVYISPQPLMRQPCQAKYVFSCPNRAGLSLMEFWIEMDILTWTRTFVRWTTKKRRVTSRRENENIATLPPSDHRQGEKTLTECVKISTVFLSPLFCSAHHLKWPVSQAASLVLLLSFSSSLLLLSTQIKSKSFWHWVEYWNNSSQRMISSLISYIGLEFTICWESKHQRLWNQDDLHSPDLRAAEVLYY